MTEDEYLAARTAMVEQQLKGRRIADSRVLMAMQTVPRHLFVPDPLRDHAYDDSPLPIGSDQTISQPYIVAYMSELLQLNGSETVLEIGTGSGYQTAVLCQLARQVYSLERFAGLAETARGRLQQLGYRNVEVYVGDGSQGLPDMAPFDAILVTAVAPAVPAPLRTQLTPSGGRLVIPVGSGERQHLVQVVRQGERWRIRQVGAVRFVPLVGRYGFEA